MGKQQALSSPGILLHRACPGAKGEAVKSQNIAIDFRYPPAKLSQTGRRGELLLEKNKIKNH